MNNIPDPNISGLEQSERIVSIYTHLQDFFPHFKRVYEQQADMQPPTSPVLSELNTVSFRSKDLASLINVFYQRLFPNLPVPEPAGGPTTLPPPQNVFQQKVYGCVVLKTYKDFLSNVARELRTLKNEVCGRGKEMNTLFWWRPQAGLGQSAFNMIKLNGLRRTSIDKRVSRWLVHQCNEGYLCYLIFIFSWDLRE